MLTLRECKRQLKDMGVETTYAIAERKDGRYCILDLVNWPLGWNRRIRRKPHGPLAGKIYPTYDEALVAIVESATRV